MEEAIQKIQEYKRINQHEPYDANKGDLLP